MYQEVQHKEMNIREIWRDELKLTKNVESNYWIEVIHEMIHGIEAHRKNK